MHRPQAVHILKKELHEGWEVILRNQFHDILPGSSIKEVYDDSKAEYEGIFAENKALTDATLAHIAAGVKAPKHSLVVYNPNSAAAYDLVTFTVPKEWKNLQFTMARPNWLFRKLQTAHMYSLPQASQEKDIRLIS